MLLQIRINKSEMKRDLLMSKDYNTNILYNYTVSRSNAPTNTYKGIVADCKDIAKYLDNNDINITYLLKPSYSEEFIQYLTNRYATATVKRRLCTLRSILYWCQDNGYISDKADIEVYDTLSTPKRLFACRSSIHKLYEFCKVLAESEDYVMARAKLECLMIVVCGLKVSELSNLLISDVCSKVTESRLRMFKLAHEDNIRTFLNIRERFVEERSLNSEILFLNKYGNINTRIYMDYELIRENCNIDKSATLSSVRNTCVREYSILLENDTVTSNIFDVTMRWLELIRDQYVKNIDDLTADEIALIEKYRKLTDIQKDKLLNMY